MDTIKSKLLECHINFPGYGERSSQELAVMAKMFVRHLEGRSDAEISAAFDHHIRTADRFPTIADIVRAATPVVMYRMDGGPLGFAALYHSGHPYVRLQARIGTDLTKYEVMVSPADAVAARIEAKNSPAIEFAEDEEKIIEPRTGSGFRRLEYGA